MDAPLNTDEIRARVKFIAELQPGDKVLCKNPQSLAKQPPSMSASVRRWYNGESRNGTLEFVEQTINAAMQIMPTLSASEQGYLQHDLERAMRGLGSIESTYRGDTIVTGRVEVLCENLRKFMTRVGVTPRQLSPTPHVHAYGSGHHGTQSVRRGKRPNGEELAQTVHSAQ